MKILGEDAMNYGGGITGRANRMLDFMVQVGGIARGAIEGVVTSLCGGCTKL